MRSSEPNTRRNSPNPAGSGAGRQAVIIGGGIVGIANALYLLKDGWRVTVLDPEAPGETTSGGNSGLFALAHVTPVAMPGILPRLPAMLLDKESSLTIRWRYLPRLLPWMFHFLKASTPGRVEAISRALADLIGGAWDAYQPLIEDAGAADLVRRRGLLLAFRDDSFLTTMKRELDIRRRLGIRYDVLADDEMRQLVPALSPTYCRGIFYPDCGHTVNSKHLVQKLAAEAARKGGTFVRHRATGFEFGSKGVSAVLSEDAFHPADLVVLAAGAWSKPLAALLGCRLPLDTERGYHVTVADPGVEIELPIISGDLRFCITPRASGLRIGGTVEFAGLDAPPDPSRQAAMVKHARRMLPGLRIEGASYWMGFRPSMPDSLPVIGRSPRHANTYFAFGHGHVGLTLAAITGRTIADLVAGRAPAFDLQPFRADRFS